MANQSNEFSGAFRQDTASELQRHAGDAPRAFQGLPGNISGVAKLARLEFKQYTSDTKQKKADGSSAAGEWFFQGTGIVMTPQTVMTANGEVKVAGEQTRPMAIPICAIKTNKGEVRSEWQQVRRIMDELVLLSGNQFLFCHNNDPKQPKTITRDLLKQVADALVAESLRRSQAAPNGRGGIFFKFDTTQSKPTLLNPNPMVFENWRGVKGLENWTPPDFAAAAVQDANAAAAAPAQQQLAPPPQVQYQPPVAPPPQSQPQAQYQPSQAQQPTTQVAAPPPPPPPQTAVSASPSGDDDEIERLFKLAIGDTTLPSTADAQQALLRMCVANGWTQDEVDNEKTTWDDMKRMARERKQVAVPTQPTPTQNGAPYANGAPRKGDTLQYSKVPFCDRGQWRSTRVQVTEINQDGTYDLLSLDDGKTAYQRVPAGDVAAI